MNVEKVHHYRMTLSLEEQKELKEAFAFLDTCYRDWRTQPELEILQRVHCLLQCEETDD
jgi:hypothetical protein